MLGPPWRRVSTAFAISCALAVVGCAGCDSVPAADQTSSETRLESPLDSPAGSPSPAAPVVFDPCHRGSVVYCALNPAVTEATIGSTICVRGWTATVRPPTSYTEPLKVSQIATEGLPGPVSAYEEDHRVPLELGGSPADPLNLSPEAHPASYAKDSAENVAKAEVCAGADLRTVQAAFIARWLAPYPGYR